MNFAYSDDQRASETVMDRVFQDLNGIGLTRRAYAGHPPDWQEMHDAGRILAEQGLFGAFIAEDEGGSGLGLLEVVPVAARAGARLLPLSIAAVMEILWALGRFATPDVRARWLPGIADGSRLAVLADGAFFAPATVTRDGAGWRVSVEEILVPHPDAADLVVIPATAPDGPALLVLERDELLIDSLEVWDRAQPAGRLTLREHPLGAERIVMLGWDGQADLIALSRILAAADLYGVMGETLTRTVEYLKTRRQFGGPIGRFQALKHTAAADHVRIVNAELALRFAALAFSENHPARSFYAALCKAYASEHAITVTEDGVHLHGGMGFTWDADLHLFLKRAWRLAAVGGTAARCRREMAAFAFTEDGSVKLGSLQQLS